MQTPSPRDDARTIPAIGVILAGGRSVRMGVDKATLRMRDGRTLAEAVDEAMIGACDEVLVAGSDAVLPHRRHVRDSVADSGPLAGIDAALRVCGDRHVLAVPCDMPRVTTALLARLLVATNAEMTVFEDEPGGSVDRPRCLPARFAPATLRAVGELLARRDLAVKRLPELVTLMRVPLSRDDALLLMNVNTPGEFAALGAVPSPALREGVARERSDRDG